MGQISFHRIYNDLVLLFFSFLLFAFSSLFSLLFISFLSPSFSPSFLPSSSLLSFFPLFICFFVSSLLFLLFCCCSYDFQLLTFFLSLSCLGQHCQIPQMSALLKSFHVFKKQSGTIISHTLKCPMLVLCITKRVVSKTAVNVGPSTQCYLMVNRCYLKHPKINCDTFLITYIITKCYTQ